MNKRNDPALFGLFDKVLAEARAFFVLGRPDDMDAAGTREMIYRWVCKRLGHDVPPIMVSAALKVLRDNKAILFDKRVWWMISDR